MSPTHSPETPRSPKNDSTSTFGVAVAQKFVVSAAVVTEAPAVVRKVPNSEAAGDGPTEDVGCRNLTEARCGFF